MTPDDDFKRKLITDLLDRVERAERAILIDLHCPTDVVAIYAILKGEQRVPWPTRRAARATTRARHAMHALVLLAQTRAHLALGHEDPFLAAHNALLAGLHANDVAANAVLAAGTKRGGQARGRQKADEATTYDRDIARYYRQWEQSDELQATYGYRSPVRYIKDRIYAKHKTHLDTRTIQRTLRRLHLRTRQ
jgi:hypothetical protein